MLWEGKVINPIFKMFPTFPYVSFLMVSEKEAFTIVERQNFNSVFYMEIIFLFFQEKLFYWV